MAKSGYRVANWVERDKMGKKGTYGQRNGEKWLKSGEEWQKCVENDKKENAYKDINKSELGWAYSLGLSWAQLTLWAGLISLSRSVTHADMVPTPTTA